MTELPTADLIRQKLRAIESLEGQKKEITDEIAQEFADAKSQGLDVSALKKLIAERKQDPDKLEEAKSILDLYRDAAGG
ncbi:GapR family DNA-binding domain-containing protein [Paracoccus litorisediminis]|uniref:GapR family DNA-binding domain-containing protein n=1 Tax=Paracoccus litorisediminis TaxID=2006130 RepID=UPI003731B96D